MRIAVHWLLMSDIGEVLKKIVDAEAFPDYAIPEKRAELKKAQAKRAEAMNSLVGILQLSSELRPAFSGEGS